MMTLAEKDQKETREKIWKEAREKTWKEAWEYFALKLIGEGLDVTTVVRCTELSPEAVEHLMQKRRSS